MKSSDKLTVLKTRLVFEYELTGSGLPTLSEESSRRISEMNPDNITEEEISSILDDFNRDNGENWVPKINYYLETVSEEFDPNDRLSRSAKRKIDYLNEHLASEVIEIAKGMLHLEIQLNEIYVFGRDAGSKARRFVIKKLESDFAKRLNSRFPQDPGRPRTRDRSDYVQKKKEFAETCFDCLTKLQEKDIELTVTNLACEMYPCEEPGTFIANPAKALTNNLKKFDISMEELLGSFTGEGPEYVDLFDDEQMVLDRLLNL